MFPKHNGYERIPVSFDLNLIVLVPLTNNYNAGSYKIFVFSVKLIEYIFPALGVCSNLCVGPFPKNKLSFFLLSIFVDELISTPKIITFLPNPVPGNEKLICLSDPIPQPEYPYLSISAFLVNVTAPN